MRKLILGLILGVLCSQINAGDKLEPRVLQYKNDPNNGVNGEYAFKYSLSDDTEREESGSFEGEDNYVVRGFYKYTDPRGTTQYVSFHADKTGYHPVVVKLEELAPIRPPTGVGIPGEIFTSVPGPVIATLLG